MNWTGLQNNCGATVVYGLDSGDYKLLVRSALQYKSGLVVFSDKINSYGQKLFEFIQAEGLGEVVASPVGLNRVHMSKIQVFVWAPDFIALEAWQKINDPPKPKKEPKAEVSKPINAVPPSVYTPTFVLPEGRESKEFIASLNKSYARQLGVK